MVNPGKGRAPMSGGHPRLRLSARQAGAAPLCDRGWGHQRHQPRQPVRLPRTGRPAVFTTDGPPIGIPFIGRAIEEGKIPGVGCAFEQATKARRQPVNTPPLKGERLLGSRNDLDAGGAVRLEDALCGD
jgi:hypothetical protein